MIVRRRPLKVTYRRDVGPYTVDVFEGRVMVYRHGWRNKCGRHDEDRNVREVRFPMNPGRLPQ